MNAMIRLSIAALSLGIAVAGCAVDTTSPPSPANPEPEAAAESAPPKARLRVSEFPSASDPRIDVREAAPFVVQNDAARVASAYVGSALGTPSFPSDDMDLMAAPVHGDPSEPGGGGGGGDPGEHAPGVQLSYTGTTQLGMVYFCTPGSSGSLVRIAPDGSRTTVLNPAACGDGVSFIDGGLTPGAKYCYELSFSGKKYTGCNTTFFEPYVFAGPSLPAADANAMAARFDWRKTNAVSTTGSDGKVALYEMNVLVQGNEDVYALRSLGMHTQIQPLFAAEQSTWSGAHSGAVVSGKLAGMWITAIVPGAVYNDIRTQSIARVTANKVAGVTAMVFRRAPVSDALQYPNPSVKVSPLKLDYLARMGVDFNGYTSCEDGICSAQFALFGWLARKVITFVAQFVDDVVHDVRRLLGVVERLVKGDVKLTLQLTVKNSDPKFPASDPVISGWKGTQLQLANLKVRVYQNVAEFDGTTDAKGQATITISKALSGKVCVDLENDKVRLIDSFITREVCFGSFPKMTTDTPILTPVQFSTNDGYVNQLAIMTDTADYVKTVAKFTMPKLEVATGWLADAATFINGGRSFVTCQGRFPNLIANLGAYAGAIITPLVTLLAEVAELGTAYDIIFDDSSIQSRGVGAHEYGHAVMCSMMFNASFAKGQTAWADIMVGTLGGQTVDTQQAVIAEGWADFVALQVVGGTNYSSPDAAFVSSNNMDYCNDSVTGNCFESNFLRCEPNCGSDGFVRNVKWVTSLLQDAFDRVPANPTAALPVNQPNDGSMWTKDTATAKVVRANSGRSVVAEPWDEIALPGNGMYALIDRWADRGSTLRYASFFGGLAQVMADNGYSRAQGCSLYAAHDANGPCPSFVSDPLPVVLPPPSANPPTPANPGPPPVDDPGGIDGICTGNIALHAPGCREP